MKRLLRTAALGCAMALLGACGQGDRISRDTQPFDGIAADETLNLSGTEPFWAFTIAGDNATYTSPDNPDGTAFQVSRFAGNNGLGFSGELEGEAIQIAVTPGSCNDGMSDRDYPFTVTAAWGERTLQGCGYTESQPYSGDAQP